MYPSSTVAVDQFAIAVFRNDERSYGHWIEFRLQHESGERNIGREHGH